MKDSTKKIKNKKWRKPPGPFKNSSLVEWLLLNQADPVIHPLVLTGRWTLDGNVNFAPGNRKGSKLLQLSYSNLGIMLLDTKWGCPLHYQKKKKKKRKKQVAKRKTSNDICSTSSQNLEPEIYSFYRKPNFIHSVRIKYCQCFSFKL